MRKLVFLAIVFVAIGCRNGNNNQQTKVVSGGFVINGQVNGIDSGWVYLGYNDSAGMVQDSAKLLNHKFLFTGKVKEPTLYYMWMGSNGQPVSFFVEDTVISITADKDSIDKAVIKGSHTQQLYETYKNTMKPFAMQRMGISEMYDKVAKSGDKKAMDSLVKAYYKVDDDEHDAIISFIQSNPSSVIGAWAVTRNMLYNSELAKLKKAYEALSPSIQQTTYGIEIKKTIDITERLAIGNSAPDFTQNDSTGNPVSLSLFKGKYVLLDFWASWCGPCRRENPNVVAAYNKFKNKNFTILSVSLDENKGAWLKAINDDHLRWNHVSDLKGWKNAAAAQYGIKAIPSNFLISPDGKILAHNLRGEALGDTLAVILK